MYDVLAVMVKNCPKMANTFYDPIFIFMSRKYCFNIVV